MNLRILAVVLGLASWAPGPLALEWSGGVTAVLQAAGEDRPEPSASASVDLFVRSDTGAGEWLLYLEGATTPRRDGVSAILPVANADAASALDGGGSGRIQVSEFNYRRATGSREWTLGLIDPTAYLDRSRITNDENTHFIGAHFVNNPTIAFPDYGLGAVYRHELDSAPLALTVLAAGSHGLGDNPGRSYDELLEPAAAGKGAFLATGLTWRVAPWSVRAGAWRRTDPDGPGGGAFGVFGWQMGRHALSLRGGLAAPAPGGARRFVALGYRHGIDARRTVGAGVAHAHNGVTGAAAPARDETVLELYARVALGRSEGHHLTASLQWLKDPGFGSARPTLGRRATVFGLRYHIAW